MQVNSLVLSLALPAATTAAEFAVGAAHSLGDAFTRFLTQSTVDEAPQAGRLAWSEKLGDFAERLRGFLGEHSIHEGFRIRLEKTASGESAGSVSGPNAESVAALLEQHSEWLLNLGTIASTMQAAYKDIAAIQPPRVNIEISGDRADHWLTP